MTKASRNRLPSVQMYLESRQARSGRDKNQSVASVERRIRPRYQHVVATEDREDSHVIVERPAGADYSVPPGAVRPHDTDHEAPAAGQLDRNAAAEQREEIDFSHVARLQHLALLEEPKGNP